jgi:hypothetical protein
MPPSLITMREAERYSASEISSGGKRLRKNAWGARIPLPAIFERKNEGERRFREAGGTLGVRFVNPFRGEKDGVVTNSWNT